MANTKIINTKHDIVCSIYVGGDLDVMHTLEVARSKRADAVAVMMGLVLDAAQEQENVTASISVSVFKKSLVFDGAFWHYV